MIQSPPARGRGLKHVVNVESRIFVVAPRAGAWIETAFLPSAPRAGGVAPRAGAWIETISPIKAA